MNGNQGMQRLIPLVNKLQDTFFSLSVPLNLNLPQIAVVGCQSAGKSSVLENFVGNDFLPRGSGIVTRRPLIIQLINSNTEHAEFLHMKNKKFTDFGEVRKEIEVETDRVTGKNKGISNIPINLRIYSPRVLNLTLIDLPGLTKVAIDDQPQDIEQQIREMVLGFIEPESTLILAVSPANTDLANSDALKIAKEVDPNGIRTIGVITKLDLMDEGTDARKILENKLLPLRRGYIGVVNRSQKDIDGRMDIQAAIATERKFFLSHPAYRHIADRMGTAFLQSTLNQQLTNHIHDTLPSLRNRIQSQLLCLEKEVESFKKLNVDDPSYKTKALIHLVNNFSQRFINNIDGHSGTISVDSLSGGAEINRIFHELYPLELLEVQLYKRNLCRDIAYAINNVQGIRGGLFTPNQAFDVIVKQHIHCLLGPSLGCVDRVVTKLSTLVHTCLGEISSYPLLADEVERSINLRIREAELKTKDQLKALSSYQLAYINTNHEDFIAFNNSDSRDSQEQSKQKLGNQIICKGWLALLNGKLLRGGSKYFWFVLTTESLVWYRDDEEREKKFVLPLEGLRQRSGDVSFFSRRPNFSLFHPNAKVNVFKEFKTLDLAGDTVDACDKWKGALFRAGVFPETSAETPEKDDTDELNINKNPILKRQVETIRNLVQSYMKIVIKTQLDLVPKITMHLLIDDVKNFLKADLLPALYSLDTSRLMEESQEETRRKRDLVAMYNSMKEALGIIADVTAYTVTTPLPPPITNDWREEVVNDSPPTTTTTTTTSRNESSYSLDWGPPQSAFVTAASGVSQSHANSRSSASLGAPPPPLVPARSTPLIPQPVVHPSVSTGDLQSTLVHKGASRTLYSSTYWDSHDELKMFDPIRPTRTAVAPPPASQEPEALTTTRALTEFFENPSSSLPGPPIPPRPI